MLYDCPSCILKEQDEVKLAKEAEEPQPGATLWVSLGWTLC